MKMNKKKFAIIGLVSTMIILGGCGIKTEKTVETQKETLNTNIQLETELTERTQETKVVELQENQVQEMNSQLQEETKNNNGGAIIEEINPKDYDIEEGEVDIQFEE